MGYHKNEGGYKKTNKETENKKNNRILKEARESGSCHPEYAKVLDRLCAERIQRSALSGSAHDASIVPLRILK